MKPVPFPGQNHVLQPPAGMDNCEPLPCHYSRHGVTSCWELSPEEQAEVAKTGRLFVLVWGQGQPPISLATAAPWVAEETVIVCPECDGTGKVIGKATCAYCGGRGQVLA